jgi:vitamin B12 transporter
MKKTFYLIVLLAFLFPCYFSLPAQEAESETEGVSQTAPGNAPDQPLKYDIVVTANRTDTPQQELGSTFTVITARQLERMQTVMVLDALRTVPDLDVVQTGGAGGQSSVFIRGAKSEHTLLLLDGVEINDPSTPGRSVDLANLAAANIERIEIICGPQSVLYGSDAMGGVIHIISKAGRGKLNGFLQGGYGSFNSFAENAGLSGGNGRANFSLGMTRSDTDGISAANKDAGNFEKDGYGATTVSGRLGLDPHRNVHADLVLRYVDSRTDLDNAGGAGGDDPNSTAAAKQWSARAQARLTLCDGRWEQTVGFSFSRQERNYENGTDDDHPFDSDRSLYIGKMLRIDWQHQLRLIKGHALLAGIESEQEQGESDYHSESAWGPYDSLFERQAARTLAGYVQDHVRLADGWFVTLGARFDDHDRFGTKATFRIASTCRIRNSGTRIKATYGSGFKAPSLYQLYSFYGDEALEPETSSGWDAGIEQSFRGERLILGATYFSNEFEQMIDFDSVNWKYVNIGAAKTSGFELSAVAHVGSAWTLSAGYTFTDAEETASGEDLLRRAKHKANVSASCRFGEKVDASLDMQYVGRRLDIDYSALPAARVALDDYLLVNLALGYELDGRTRLFAAIRNLGNARYEEVLGYGTPGISASAGIKYSF